MTIWFTSDPHYYHINIIKYCNRPFFYVEEMNEAMIINWNNLVHPDDEVYILGDFAFCKDTQAVNILNRLMGKKYLIEGNHDKKLLKHLSFTSCFEFTKPLYELSIPDADAFYGSQRIVLCHYSMNVWNQSHRGSWHLYGHSHGSLPDNNRSLSFDVGVDAQGFKPISYEQVKIKMGMKSFQPMDHHDQSD